MSLSTKWKHGGAIAAVVLLAGCGGGSSSSDNGGSGDDGNSGGVDSGSTTSLGTGNDEAVARAVVASADGLADIGGDPPDDSLTQITPGVIDWVVTAAEEREANNGPDSGEVSCDDGGSANIDASEGGTPGELEKGDLYKTTFKEGGCRVSIETPSGGRTIVLNGVFNFEVTDGEGTAGDSDPGYEVALTNKSDWSWDNGGIGFDGALQLVNNQEPANGYDYELAQSSGESLELTRGDQTYTLRALDTEYEVDTSSDPAVYSLDTNHEVALGLDEFNGTVKVSTPDDAPLSCNLGNRPSEGELVIESTANDSSVVLEAGSTGGCSGDRVRLTVTDGDGEERRGGCQRWSSLM
jgi:hypothetical protein